VLARVVEIVEGKPFADVLRERVFEPAGMTRTLDVDGRTIVPDLARAYVPGRGELLNAPLVDLSYLTGAGSVISTVGDLLRFVSAYQDGRLGEGAWEALNGTGPEAWTGASAGYHAFVNWIPETATVVIYVGNTFGGGPGQLRGQLDALLSGEDVTPAPSPAPVVTIDADVLERYVGVYAPRPGARMEVSLRGGELLIAGSVALPVSETEFYFQNWSRTLEFAPDGEDYVLVNGDARWPRTDAR